jgi:electron transfer flavoprotein beta subunit
MNIVVLVKQVPDTTEIKLDPKTGTLIREGVASVINPDDRLALETALRLKEAHGAAVTVLSMGPPQAIDAVSEAYAMGADRAVLLCDPNFAGADTRATSFTLGRAIERLGEEEPVELVLAGRQAIDGDTAQIGPQVAEHLGWPQVTYVQELRLEDGGRLRAWRRLPEGVEEVVCPLPAVATVLDVPGEVRWPLVDRLLAACEDKAPIAVWDAATLGVKAREVGLKGSPTQVRETFSPKGERHTQWLEGSPAEQAAALLAALRGHKLL